MTVIETFTGIILALSGGLIGLNVVYIVFKSWLGWKDSKRLEAMEAQLWRIETALVRKSGRT